MSYKNAFEKILEMKVNDKTLKEIIEEDVKNCLNNKKLIEEGKIPLGPIITAICFLCSRSGRFAEVDKKCREKLETIPNVLSYFSKPENVDSFLCEVFKSESSQKEKARQKIPKLLNKLRELEETLKNLTSGEERLKKFKGKFEEILRDVGIGLKGINNLLRDCGYTERIPIDIHEKRFLLRTGIFHRYAPADGDPLNDEHLSKTLTNFSKSELAEISIGGVSLGDHPGLVDFIIWYYCQEKTTKEVNLNVCGEKPRCDNCPFSAMKLCMFAVSRAIQASI